MRILISSPMRSSVTLDKFLRPNFSKLVSVVRNLGVAFRGSSSRLLIGLHSRCWSVLQSSEDLTWSWRTVFQSGPLTHWPVELAVGLSGLFQSPHNMVSVSHRANVQSCLIRTLAVSYHSTS